MEECNKSITQTGESLVNSTPETLARNEYGTFFPEIFYDTIQCTGKLF